MGIGYTASLGMGTHMARVCTPAISTWTCEISDGDDESGVVIGSIRVSERNTGMDGRDVAGDRCPGGHRRTPSAATDNRQPMTDEYREGESNPHVLSDSEF